MQRDLAREPDGRYEIRCRLPNVRLECLLLAESAPLPRWPDNRYDFFSGDALSQSASIRLSGLGDL